MVVEFFEVVVDGFRWFYVVPRFSNYVLIIIDAKNKTPLKIIVISLSLYTVISPRPARLVNSGRPSVPSVSPCRRE